MPAAGIEDIIGRLDDIVSTCEAARDRCGYFAVLYRDVTAGVRDGVAAGRYQDGARMERLDVEFAGRYLEALEAWRRGGAPSRCWRIAFETAARWSPLILQHLLLGINAHINLDLGVAAARTCPGSSLRALRSDFDAINDLLGAMLDRVQDRIASISPWMGIIDRIGQRTDEVVFGFCLKAARDHAWRSAEKLAALPAGGTEDAIDRIDRAVATLALPISSPGLLARCALLPARLREGQDARVVMRALGGEG